MPISNLSNGLRTGVCTSTNRPTTPYEGQVIYETDTDLSYIYNGSSWQQVSGGTAVGNSGLVYVTSAGITAATTFTVSNCFTTTYDNYRVIISNFTSPSQQFVSMTLSGGTGYLTNVDYKKYDATGAGTNTSTANWQLGLSGAVAGNAIAVDIFSPFLALPTRMYGDNEGGAYYGVLHGSQTDSTSSTGFTVAWGATVSAIGTVTVFGYRKA